MLMMLSISDNLCANLILQKIGLERLEKVFKQDFGFKHSLVQRKLMDFDAKARGLDNLISFQDCIRFCKTIASFSPQEQASIQSLLSVCMGDNLFLRDIPRDTVRFYHTTGSIPNVIHDWGFTEYGRLFLLTQNVQSEPLVFNIFGKIGQQFFDQ
ncbi:MAG: class A beta-lactamase-related serine hydrolase [Anaerolineaceae bacterium]|nr:class A beta-lactamase-related serine hydrolase [Anaerolineaceae bacterium]